MNKEKEKEKEYLKESRKTNDKLVEEDTKKKQEEVRVRVKYIVHKEYL